MLRCLLPVEAGQRRLNSRPHVVPTMSAISTAINPQPSFERSTTWTAVWMTSSRRSMRPVLKVVMARMRLICLIVRFVPALAAG